MIAGSTAEKILEESRSVMVTNGEWELSNVSFVISTLQMETGNYSEIHFSVRLNYRYRTGYLLKGSNAFLFLLLR